MGERDRSSHFTGVGGMDAFLGKGTKITGKLVFEGAGRIEGQVDGEISAQDVLTVGEGALVNAKIAGTTVVIEGQVTGDVTTVTLPSVSLGDKPLRRVEALNVRVPLVDDVQDTTGAYCTLFQRMNDQGDLLRIATNVIEKDRRAIGTFIPAIDPDGQPNPVAAATGPIDEVR